MKFKKRNLRAIAETIIGDASYFPYRSSSFITQFFEECDLDFVHDGSTRWAWTADRIAELLEEPQSAPNTLPGEHRNVWGTLKKSGGHFKRNFGFFIVGFCAHFRIPFLKVISQFSVQHGGSRL
jgi:hypothetical protein